MPLAITGSGEQTGGRHSETTHGLNLRETCTASGTMGSWHRISEVASDRGARIAVAPPYSGYKYEGFSKRDLHHYHVSTSYLHTAITIFHDTHQQTHSRSSSLVTPSQSTSAPRLHILSHPPPPPPSPSQHSYPPL